jgi:hypothetical protein
VPQSASVLQSFGWQEAITVVNGPPSGVLHLVSGGQEGSGTGTVSM